MPKTVGARDAPFGSFGNAERSQRKAWRWRGGMRGSGDAGSRVSAVFGTFGNAESRHPSAYL